MQVPENPAAGDGWVPAADVGRYLDSAARHAAIVSQRLMDADDEFNARFLDREFTRIFGQRYDDAVVRVLRAPGSDTTASNNSNGQG